MGCVRFSMSSTAMGCSQMGSQNLSRDATSSRFGPSLKVIRAVQISGVKSQGGETAQEGGDKKISGNLYQVLGLNKSATAQDIKKAYRKLARQFHPDAVSSVPEKSSSTEMFLQIKSAYSVLSKPDDRAQYDRQLLMQQRMNWKRVDSRGGYDVLSGHRGRNWETDQCW